MLQMGSQCKVAFKTKNGSQMVVQILREETTTGLEVNLDAVMGLVELTREVRKERTKLLAGTSLSQGYEAKM